MNDTGHSMGKKILQGKRWSTYSAASTPEYRTSQPRGKQAIRLENDFETRAFTKVIITKIIQGTHLSTFSLQW